MNEPERIGCEEALERLAAHLDRELTPGESEEVERHLATCRSCYSRAEFERRLKERIRNEMRVRTLPHGLEDRVRTLVRDISGED